MIVDPILRDIVGRRTEITSSMVKEAREKQKSLMSEGFVDRSWLQYQAGMAAAQQAAMLSNLWANRGLIPFSPYGGILGGLGIYRCPNYCPYCGGKLR